MSRFEHKGDEMELYQVETPLPCDIEGCLNKNAVLIVRTDGKNDYAVCPGCVRLMSDMNNENAAFFAQTPLPGMVVSTSTEGQ